MRMVAADYDGDVSLADALADSRAPVFVERLVDRPVGDAEWGVRQARLSDKRVSQLFIVVEVKADEGSLLGHIDVSFADMLGRMPARCRAWHVIARLWLTVVGSRGWIDFDC